MVWLSALCGLLIIIIAVLVIKVKLIYKAIKEIRMELGDKIDHDTNILISVSSRNCHVRQFAADLNVQLRKLRNERRKYQSGDQMLKDAVTNISHDLRTPLTAICGYLMLLKREEKSETVNRYLTVIEGRTEVLNQLTEEFFRYSLILTATDQSAFEEVSLNSLLEESISAYYAALKGCGIKPTINLPEQRVLRRLDRSAVSRIFGNIISNAIKYSDGDLEITLLTTGEIICSNQASQLNELQTGKLFNRFYTVSDAKKSTGLGLSIAKTLTEQMNGIMLAKYQDGRLYIHIKF